MEKRDNLIEIAKSEIMIKEYEDETLANLAQVFLNADTHEQPYHLTFDFVDWEAAQEFADILAMLDVFPKMIERRSGAVVSIKSKECVCNLLAAVGAHNALLELNNEIVMRELKANANRATNCDAANIKKQVNCATSQIEHVEMLIRSGKINGMPHKLQETARARIDNPTATLLELAKILGVTKSGVVNRLRKVMAVR